MNNNYLLHKKTVTLIALHSLFFGNNSFGQTLVYDINSGSGSSEPFGLIAIDAYLFFSADNGTKGYELWKYDGTSTKPPTYCPKKLYFT